MDRILIRDTIAKEHAETIALQGLAFLAGRDEDIERFLRNSGLDADALRARAADPDVLRAVIEYILAGDATTQDFCAASGLNPRALHAAGHALGSFREI